MMINTKITTVHISVNRQHVAKMTVSNFMVPGQQYLEMCLDLCYYLHLCKKQISIRQAL